VDPAIHEALDVANDACTAVFVLEALLKLVGYGCEDYLREGWNLFDLLVVLVAVGEKLLTVFAGVLFKGSLLRVVRLARAARVLRTLRLIHASRRLQTLLMTLLYSVPPLLNILLIFTILMFVYAVLGMELFSGVMWGDYLNEEANFCSFSGALLTMFRCATGEDWNGIMHDLLVTPERGCRPELHNCGNWLAKPFFVTYTILSTFVVLKMLVALIVENYKRSHREDRRLVRTSHRDAFVESWAEIDPDGVGHIAVAQLPSLIRRLEPPLGPDHHALRAVGGHDPLSPWSGAKTKERAISQFIMTLDIAAYQLAKDGAKVKVVRFVDVLLALTTRALNAQSRAEPAASPSSPAAGGLASDAPVHGGQLSERPSPISDRFTSQPSKPHLSRRAASMKEVGSSTTASLGGVSRGEGSISIGATESAGPAGDGDVMSDEADEARTKWQAMRGRSRSVVVGSEAASELAQLHLRFLDRAIEEREADESGQGLWGEDDEEAEGIQATSFKIAKTLIFSLSDEYAVTVIQRRWRERKRRRAQRTEMLKQTAEASRSFAKPKAKVPGGPMRQPTAPAMLMGGRKSGKLDVTA
jgi:hypothetical protein